MLEIDSHPKYVFYQFIVSDPDKIGQLLSDSIFEAHQMQLLSESIFEAHQMTCLLTREQIHVGWSQGINKYKVDQFRKMVSVLH